MEKLRGDQFPECQDGLFVLDDEVIRQVAGQGVEFGVDESPGALFPFVGAVQFVHHADVFLMQLFRFFMRLRRFFGIAEVAQFHQRVGRAGHRGQHDDLRVGVVADDPRHFPHPFGGTDRCAAELVYFHLVVVHFSMICGKISAE